MVLLTTTMFAKDEGVHRPIDVIGLNTGARDVSEAAARIVERLGEGPQASPMGWQRAAHIGAP
jgi:hypothetical protein